MKKLPLFDLHCDTLTEAYNKGKHLRTNDLHISFEKLSDFKPYCQVLAVWSSHKSNCESAWNKFLEARRFLDDELKLNPNVRFASEYGELSGSDCTVLLAVEGGKLIGSDLSRLKVMRSLGVRFLTLTWNDPCLICGANGTDGGVTEFGFAVLDRCRTLGIIPDISHASDKAASDVITHCEENGGICVATHSNSRVVCNHSRNLTDELFMRLVRLGALVGISMAPMHLCDGGKADVSHITEHIMHYLSLGGEDTVCLGCDFDGIVDTPDGIASVSELYALADALAHCGCSDELIDKIFHQNAMNFMSRHLKNK